MLIEPFVCLGNGSLVTHIALVHRFICNGIHKTQLIATCRKQGMHIGFAILFIPQNVYQTMHVTSSGSQATWAFQL